MVIPIPSFLVSPYSLSLQCDFFLSRENSLSFILVKADIVAPALRADGDVSSAPVNGEAVLFQQAQQLLQAGRFLRQCPVNGLTQLLLVGGLRRVTQPLVVALDAPLGSLHNGVTVLNADGIAQTVDGAGAAPKVAELAVTLQRGGVPYNMVVDVSLVNVGADDESVLVLGKSPGQLYAQPVGFLRRDLARHKGLPQVVGNHIVRTAHPAGAGGVGLLVQQELRIGPEPGLLQKGGENPRARQGARGEDTGGSNGKARGPAGGDARRTGLLTISA